LPPARRYASTAGQARFGKARVRHYQQITAIDPQLLDQFLFRNVAESNAFNAAPRISRVIWAPSICGKSLSQKTKAVPEWLYPGERPMTSQKGDRETKWLPPRHQFL
jgi:hypothetical protein